LRPGQSGPVSIDTFSPVARACRAAADLLPRLR